MILQSNSLREEQFLESNLRKLKLITETRLAAILLEPKLNEICTNIISQDYFHQKIKATLLMGYASACKTFKVRLFVIRKVIPLLSDQLRLYRGTLDLFLLEAMIKLLIASGGYLDRNVFIPGQSR